MPASIIDFGFRKTNNLRSYAMKKGSWLNNGEHSDCFIYQQLCANSLSHLVENEALTLLSVLINSFRTFSVCSSLHTHFFWCLGSFGDGILFVPLFFLSLRVTFLPWDSVRTFCFFLYSMTDHTDVSPNLKTLRYSGFCGVWHPNFVSGYAAFQFCGCECVHSKLVRVCAFH